MSDSGAGKNAHSGAPEVLATRLVYSGWGRFLVARLRLKNGEEIEREIEDHGVAVAVLPYDPVQRVALLIRQLRPPALLAAGLPEMLEVPAGRLDSDNPQACAIREAFEEAGVRLRALEPIVAGWTMPAVSTERIHLFLGRYEAADRTAPGGGLAAEQEYVTVEATPLDKLARMVDAGELVDLKSFILIMALRQRYPDLFTGTVARTAPLLRPSDPI